MAGNWFHCRQLLFFILRLDLKHYLVSGTFVLYTLYTTLPTCYTITYYYHRKKNNKKTKKEEEEEEEEEKDGTNGFFFLD